jgi:hypothetical protein
MSKLYEFCVTMTGWGESPEEAWENCQENFDISEESLPDTFEIIDED